ncbi:MAG: ATP synthase F0 subunit B [Pseudomonadota bacterium]
MLVWILITLWPAVSRAADDSAGAGISVPTIFNFAILVTGLAVLLRKPLGEMLRGKQARISRAVEEAEQLRTDAESLATEYRARLAGLEEDVARILKEAREEGGREKEEILERAHKMAARIAAETGLSMERDRLRVLRDLERETLTAALRKAEELLRQRATEADHRIFTNELIANLENQRGARS